MIGRCANIPSLEDKILGTARLIGREIVRQGTEVMGERNTNPEVPSVIGILRHLSEFLCKIEHLSFAACRIIQKREG